jgi:hypothetical protein
MLKVQGEWIRDEEGRRLILRGANLGGSSKVPFRPDGASRFKEGFYEYRDVSFVGRPFPLSEADEHFGNLASWGLRFLRLIVTWEAVEHAGPGVYDRDYLGYLRAIAESAARHGIDLYLDPHQDVWSRWTGGDGAPAWTLEAVGFDLKKINASGSGIVHAETPELPRQIWGANYNRLACATMFSLFLGGNEFAPGIKIEGETVQDYLQAHFLESMRRVLIALKGLPNLVGYGALNEPDAGFLGLSDLARLERFTIRKGPMPTPFQAMAAGSGYPQKVANWHLGLSGNYAAGKALLNAEGVSAWKEGAECVWKRAGVWDDPGGKPVLKRPGHFYRSGNAADLFLKPLMLSFAKMARIVEPRGLFFVEAFPHAEHPSWGPEDPGNAVNGSHWYDNATMVTKRFQEIFNVDSRKMKFYFGPKGVRRCFADSIGYWKEIARLDMGGIPTLLGETGLPFDMNGRSAFRSGDFRAHEKALSLYFEAFDRYLLSVCVWNYCADNSNELGDKWNDEDLSIFCRDQGGARALKGFCRPYAWKTAGTPLSMAFDPKRALFEYRFRSDPAIEAPTLIYVPACHYPAGYRAEAFPPEAVALERDEASSLLIVRPSGGADTEIRIILRPEQSDTK